MAKSVANTAAFLLSVESKAYSAVSYKAERMEVNKNLDLARDQKDLPPLELEESLDPAYMYKVLLEHISFNPVLFAESL